MSRLGLTITEKQWWMSKWMNQSVRARVVRRSVYFSVHFLSNWDRPDIPLFFQLPVINEDYDHYSFILLYSRRNALQPTCVVIFSLYFFLLIYKYVLEDNYFSHINSVSLHSSCLSNDRGNVFLPSSRFLLDIIGWSVYLWF